MADFLVYRHGSNAANQGMCPKAPIAIVTAPDRGEAETTAARVVNCYANQHLEVVPSSRAKVDDWNHVVENGSRVDGEPDVVSVED